MTKEEAAQLLNVSVNASPAEIQSKFQELYNEYNIRLTNAPTPNLKRIYNSNLDELNTAFTLLSGKTAAAVSDLPASTPTYKKAAETAYVPQAPKPVLKAKPKRGLPPYVIAIIGIAVIVIAVATFGGIYYFQNPPPLQIQLQQKEKTTGEPAATSPKEAQVIITWLGPGSVNLVFGDEEYFFTQQQEKELAFAVDNPYTLKAKKPDKTYPYSDFLGFVKGKQYYHISISDTKLVVVKTISKQEQAAMDSAASVQAESNRIAQQQAAAGAHKSVLNSLSANMVYLSGGSYTMGAGSEAPSITLSGFYLSKYEVTQAQWQAIMGSNPSNFSGCAQCPVESVSWNDIQDFLRKLNSQTGKNFRLPTEAEWEYAARGGNKSRGYTYSGSNDINSVAWYKDNSSSKTHAVGQKQPNELGIYDMSGNVWEWCSDWYEVNTTRVVRGGSWGNFDDGCRSSIRYWIFPDFRSVKVGFRLAQD